MAGRAPHPLTAIHSLSTHKSRILAQPFRAAARAIAHALSPGQALAVAVLGFAGYVRARRQGLTRSKCVLRDTRLVLAYLALLALAGTAAIGWRVYHFFA